MNELSKTATHGARANWRPDDGVRRVTEIIRFEDDTFMLRLETYWEGDDKPPMATQINFSPAAYSVISDLLLDFALHRESYRVEKSA